MVSFLLDCCNNVPSDRETTLIVGTIDTTDVNVMPGSISPPPQLFSVSSTSEVLKTVAVPIGSSTTTGRIYSNEGLGFFVNKAFAPSMYAAVVSPIHLTNVVSAFDVFIRFARRVHRFPAEFLRRAMRFKPRSFELPWRVLAQKWFWSFSSQNRYTTRQSCHRGKPINRMPMIETALLCLPLTCINASIPTTRSIFDTHHPIRSGQDVVGNQYENTAMVTAQLKNSIDPWSSVFLFCFLMSLFY